MVDLGSSPAQRYFVKRFIDWNLVESRCEHYPAIGKAFPLAKLKKGSERPPYYCHYMAWRLGTWSDVSLVKRLDELLGCAQVLPNWKHEQSLLASNDFADFWSLVWQIQVAEYLCNVGNDVSWSKSGPDLSVSIGDEQWFVECYVYRKSFGLFSFIEEVFQRIDHCICAEYNRCLPFRLPQDNSRTGFLHDVFSPFLDSRYLSNAKRRAKIKYPVPLNSDSFSPLKIYVKDDDSDNYDPSVFSNVVGDPRFFRQVALREAVNAKMNSNALGQHHPNIVAVNYLLSADFQLAEHRMKPTHFQNAFLGNNSKLDVLAASAVGIDEQLTREKFCVAEVSRSGDFDFSHLNRIALTLAD